MSEDACMIGKCVVEKIESVIPHILMTENIRSSLLVISFVPVPAKNAKPLKSLLELGGGKVGGPMYHRQR